MININNSERFKYKKQLYKNDKSRKHFVSLKFQPMRIQGSNSPMSYSGDDDGSPSRFLTQMSPGCRLKSSKGHVRGLTGPCIPARPPPRPAPPPRETAKARAALGVASCGRVGAPQGRLAILDALGSKDEDAAPGIAAVTH